MNTKPNASTLFHNPQWYFLACVFCCFSLKFSNLSLSCVCRLLASPTRIAVGWHDQEGCLYFGCDDNCHRPVAVKAWNKYITGGGCCRHPPQRPRFRLGTFLGGAKKMLHIWVAHVLEVWPQPPPLRIPPHPPARVPNHPAGGTPPRRSHCCAKEGLPCHL